MRRFPYTMLFHTAVFPKAAFDIVVLSLHLADFRLRCPVCGIHITATVHVLRVKRTGMRVVRALACVQRVR
jgi:hypothetical protein